MSEHPVSAVLKTGLEIPIPRPATDEPFCAGAARLSCLRGMASSAPRSCARSRVLMPPGPASRSVRLVRHEPGSCCHVARQRQPGSTASKGAGDRAGRSDPTRVEVRGHRRLINRRRRRGAPVRESRRDATSGVRCIGDHRPDRGRSDPAVPRAPVAYPPLATSRDGAGHPDSAGDESFGGIPEPDFDQSQPSCDCESSACEFRDGGERGSLSAR